jgi:hypothetical protein
MTQRYLSQTSVGVFAALLSAMMAGRSAWADEKPATTAGDEPALVARAPEKPKAKTYDLRYKLKRGDVLRYAVTHRASIRSTIEQETQAAQTRTDSIKAWKVTDVLKNGQIEFVNVVESVHMVNQLPDKDPIEYDSERHKTPPAGFEDAARAVGVPLSEVRISPRGKIERRDVKHKGASTDDDAPITLRLPEEPVAIGATWDESFEVVVSVDKGATKSVQTRRHHELLSVENEVATVKVTYQVLTPVDAPIECQLVQRLMEGEVKFDIAAGCVISQQMDIDKRILGFAGPTSSMQYVMRMEEKLLKKGEKLAITPMIKKNGEKLAPNPAGKTTAARNSSGKKTKTTGRTRTQQSNRSYRR